MKWSPYLLVFYSAAMIYLFGIQLPERLGIQKDLQLRKSVFPVDPSGRAPNGMLKELSLMQKQEIENDVLKSVQTELISNQINITLLEPLGSTPHGQYYRIAMKGKFSLLVRQIEHFEDQWNAISVAELRMEGPSPKKKQRQPMCYLTIHVPKEYEHD